MKALDKTKEMFWIYDEWKTKQEFTTDVAGIMNELEFMATKPETGGVWLGKATNVES